MATDMQQHFTSIAALGRSFHLGELYNYRSDKVLNGKFKITTLRMYYISLLNQCWCCLISDLACNLLLTIDQWLII